MSEKERKQQEERFEVSELKSVLLVGVYTTKDQLYICNEHLEELASLSHTYGFTVARKLTCPLKKFHPATFIGSGKVEEICDILESEGIDGVIFDDEISPNQQKNIELIVKKPVLDRTELILEVFASRAQTKEARLQIELAKIKYQMPRLKRMWTHLSRQSSGGGGTTAVKGAGETQIEIDRRTLKDRLAILEKEIKVVREQRNTQRRARIRSDIPSFAIVGYTNAGKSTLMNALTHAGILAEDKLFATLDTTTRKYVLPNKQNILLIDTVGFIRKLPHTLVAAFRSTLEEACYTDVLLHLVDVSHPMALEQAESTIEVLKQLGAENKPMITVLNKIDLCSDEASLTQFRIKYPKTVCISATERMGFNELIEMMTNELAALRKLVRLRIPQSNYALASELMREGNVLFSDYEGNDILLEVEIPAKLEYKVRSFYDITKS